MSGTFQLEKNATNYIELPVAPCCAWKLKSYALKLKKALRAKIPL